MSVKLTTQDLTGAVVGQAGTFDWTKYVPVRSEAMPQQPSAHLKVFNDSGCALDVRISQSGKTSYISPGAWPTFVLAPDDTSMTWTVEAIISGGSFARLAAVYYAPGEELDDTGALGNSPVGGAVQLTSAGDLDQYLVSAAVVSGLVATADLIVLNQLDVTSGVAFLKQPSTSVEPVSFAATNYLASTPSATYFLDLNPDGTVSWGTSHSVVPNSLPAYTVTTNVSGNIASVTTQVNSFIVNVLPASSSTVQFGSTPGSAELIANSGLFVSGGQFSVQNAIAAVGGQATAGSVGVPPIVAVPYEQHVTGTGGVTIVTITPATNGLYRISGYLRANNGTSGNAIKLQVTFTDPQKVGGGADAVFMVAVNQGTGSGLLLNGTNSITNNPYSLEPQVVDHKAGVALTVVYTDPTNTPSDFVSIAVERLS